MISSCFAAHVLFLPLSNIVLKDYGDKSPQYLVALSHSEDPWKDARIGYGPGERCTNEISDESIAEYYTSLL